MPPCTPADQVEAFAILAKNGTTVADIATRFGVTTRLVEQRLRLGNTSPILLDAYRAGGLDLDALTAFSVTTDHAHQISVWDQIKDQGYRPNAHQIKRSLTQDQIPARSSIAQFVGIESYEAAGGAVTRDLFADDNDNGVWFSDPELLNKIATTKLLVVANQLRPDWKWVDAQPDVDWQTLAQFGRVISTPATPTDEERAEIQRLETRANELNDLDDEEWTEELVTEAEAIDQRNHEIDKSLEARAIFADDDRAYSGCIATIAVDGTLQIVKGLIRADDMPTRNPNAAADNADEDEHENNFQSPRLSAPIASPADPRAEARKNAGIGIGLADDMRAIRTTLVKAELAQDFEAAFDLMLFQMGRAVFTGGYMQDALDITIREPPDRPSLRSNDDTFAQHSPGEDLLADRSGLSFDWMQHENDEDAFAALKALPDADKQALFAACVARTLKGQLAFEHDARPEFEATVARLSIDFATKIRPTADMFWSRITKANILAVARATLGDAWAQSRSKLKKTDLATTMEEAFTGEEIAAAGVPAAAREPARFWSMPGFQAYDQRGLTHETNENDSATAPATEEHQTTDVADEQAPAPQTPGNDITASQTEAAPTSANPAGPRVIINTVPFEPSPTTHDPHPTLAGEETVSASFTPTGSNDDNAESDNALLEIPDFLRRL